MEYSGESLHNIPYLSTLLTQHLDTDVEKFRAIYKWVCSNIKNDYGLFKKHMYRRKRYENDSLKFTNWNTEFRNILFKKLRKHKQTICTGYAYLVKELSKYAKINCKIIHGYGRVSTTDIENLTLPNHSWNAVQLSGKWYLCDPTWASGIPDPETLDFKFYYNDGFFLAEPQLFAVNHFPLDKKWLLLDEAKQQTLETFKTNPILYGKAYEYLELHLKPYQLKQTLKVNDTIVFTYKLKKYINTKNLLFLIHDGSYTKKTKPNHLILNQQYLNIEHSFKNRGLYDVHLYIKDDLIATYVFDVDK